MLFEDTRHILLPARDTRTDVPLGISAGDRSGRVQGDTSSDKDEEAALDEALLPASTLFYGVRGVSCRSSGCCYRISGSTSAVLSFTCMCIADGA